MVISFEVLKAVVPLLCPEICFSLPSDISIKKKPQIAHYIILNIELHPKGKDLEESFTNPICFFFS